MTYMIMFVIVLHVFADDAIIQATAPSVAQAALHLQSDVNALQQILIDLKLLLNAQKM